VDRAALGVATYRLPLSFGRRWASDLALVPLIRLVSGLALGSVAATRQIPVWAQ
jgi:hypothetical protein